MAEAQGSSERWIMDWIPSEGPQHRVKITQPFYLGKHEVTQAQWTALMGSNPAAFQGDASQPVEQVSWQDIQPFLAKLNADAAPAGMKFVLPTEAQWEYACRAGTTTTWHCGDSAETVPQYAWINTNSGGKPRPVGQLQANDFGLHDMLGNVWERCADWQAMDYYAKSPVDDPPGAAFGTHHVERGGSFLDGARVCRSASHFHGLPETRGNNHGFRVAATIDVAKLRAAAVALAATEAHNFALEFDGKDDYVDLPTLRRDTPGPLTLEGWILRNDAKGNGILIRVRGYNAQLSLMDRGGLRGGEDYSVRQLVDSTGLDTRSNAVHVALVIDEVEFRLYGNGRLFKRIDRKPTASSPSDRYSSRIGAESNLSSPFPGILDEIRVSTVARYTSDFVPQRRWSTDADTLALYHFDEGQGDELRDSSGNNHHGKIVGAKWVAVASATEVPAQQNALLFDGKPSTLVEIPSLRLARGGPLTIEGYFEPTVERIASVNTAVGFPANAICISHAEQRWSAVWQHQDMSLVICEAGPFTKGEQVHMAAVVDQGELRFYRNGKLIQRAAVNLDAQAAREELSELRIGHNFEGLIHSVRISTAARYDNDFQPPSRHAPDRDTLALYHFDEGAGDVLRDSSGNDHHGKIAGAKWVDAAGKATPSSAVDTSWISR
jgi:hypothetical protein